MVGEGLGHMQSISEAGIVETDKKFVLINTESDRNTMWPLHQ